MTIIEAFQQAENGKLITNNFLKSRGHILKYISGGVFYQYELIDGKTKYKYEVREFPLADIISIGWEVLDKNWEDLELIH
jgi:hypothetical protein